MERIPMNLFQAEVPEDILEISRKLRQAGFECWLVGGAVRDLLIHGGLDRIRLAGNDYDFATNARPEETIRVFRHSGKTKTFTVPTGLKHGTVTVVIERDGEMYNYEITTFRQDGKYEDGRHPDNVSFTSSLAEDLSRRDFTINSIAYDVVEGILVDPFDGLGDISRKVIRTVGDPLERFREDGLRPVRACRFAAQLGFVIARETLDAIPAVLETVKKVSAERIRDEFFKLMKAESPSVGIEYMRRSGILSIYLPELLEGFEVPQNEFHRFDIYWHNLYSCDSAVRDRPLVRFAGLFHDIGKARAKSYALSNGNGNVFYNHEIIGERIADRIMKRLKFSNNDQKYISRLVRMHMFYYTEDWTDGAVRRFVRKADGDNTFLSDLFELRKADRLGSGTKSGDAEILEKFRNRIQQIVEADNALKVTDLDVDGNIIMEYFHIKPSRTIGEMLEYMLDQVLDHPEWNEREKLLEMGTFFLENYEEIIALKRKQEMEMEDLA
jgi:poly(A) polymerase/tRNA nucleotidyltransferase (CCA-adding enzyme)